MMMTKNVIRNMLLHKTKGTIVHISSISAHTGYKGLAMYASSKGALEAFSKDTAREWGPLGIRSNVVLPGTIKTERWVQMGSKQIVNGTLTPIGDISDFEDIKFPKPIERTRAKNGFIRNKKDDMPVLDYYEFHNQAVSDTINYFCKQVKEYTNFEKITGVFCGYTAVNSRPRKGLHAFEQVLKSPYVDFVSSTNYGGGESWPWYFSTPVKSAQLHGKMYIAEADMKTHLRKPLTETMPHAAPDNDWYSKGIWTFNDKRGLESSINQLSLCLLRITTGCCGIWWFDMFGGFFADEKLLEVMSKTAGLMENQTHNYLKADVAYLIDETGYKYYGFNDEEELQGALPKCALNLCEAGFAYDTYLLSDIKEDNFPADNYKLFVIYGGVGMSDEDKAAIEKKLKNNNKTVLWLHASSYDDSALCGFDLDYVVEHRERAVYKNEIYNEERMQTLKFKDNDGYTLSRFEESGDPAVIWRDMGDWASVYSLPMVPHVHLLREIALLSGVHLYNLTDDYAFAGGEYVGLVVRHEHEGGYKRINLPERGFKATNVLTGEEISVNDMFIDVKMKEKETIVIHIEKSETN